MHADIHKLLNKIEQCEKLFNESIESLEARRANLRKILGTLYMIRHSLQGELEPVFHQSIRDNSATTDPNSALLPLILPHLIKMLQPGSDEVKFALVYLQSLISEGIYPCTTADLKVTMGGAQHKQKVQAKPTNFIVTLRLALNTLLKESREMEHWKKVEGILASINGF